MLIATSDIEHQAWRFINPALYQYSHLNQEHSDTFHCTTELKYTN